MWNQVLSLDQRAAAVESGCNFFWVVLNRQDRAARGEPGWDAITRKLQESHGENTHILHPLRLGIVIMSPEGHMYQTNTGNLMCFQDAFFSALHDAHLPQASWFTFAAELEKRDLWWATSVKLPSAPHLIPFLPTFYTGQNPLQVSLFGEGIKKHASFVHTFGEMAHIPFPPPPNYIHCGAPACATVRRGSRPLGQKVVAVRPKVLGGGWG